jgi:predicted transposase YbfD/YdcC
MSADFMSHFAPIPDPRIERCKRHELLDILFLSLSAVLCGAEGWEEIEDFGHARLEWLRQYFPYASGIPRHDTLARVLSRLDPEALQRSFIGWVQAASELSDGEIVAIDGKTARRTFQKGDRKSALHLVSAWACRNGLVLGQQKVDNKSNEITAIPAVLELLVLKGCIVTIDAMGTQREIARHIRDRGADYVLALKGNQATLNEEVRRLFEGPLPKGYSEQRSDEQVEGGQGRIESRQYRHILLGKHVLPAAQGWPGLKSVLEVTATRDDGQKTSTQKRYFICSLGLDVERAAQAVRQHWGIENKLHWVLDVTFREDESRIRRGNGAEVMSVLRRMTLNLLKQNTTSKASMKRKRKIAALDNKLRSEIIAGI